MVFILAAFFTSLIICFVAIPSIIALAKIKHLMDIPEGRKSHIISTPTLGGVAIFGGVIFSLTFWASQKDIVELQYIIAAIMVLFFIGIKDDLFNLVAHKKLAGQLLASVLLVHWANIRITSFYGLFGIHDLTLPLSYALTIFTIIVITNSFNLIDGIDCLAGLVGIITATSFSTWFSLVGSTQYAILAACLVGSLTGFLWYNRSPAKIFMGDTGSMIVGIVLSILSIKFIEMNRIMEVHDPYKVLSVPVITIGILIIPLFDTLRVFSIRILQGKSPLAADRNHIHHMLLDLGFSHMKSSFILAAFNLAMIGMVFGLQKMRGEMLLTLVIVICILANYVIARQVRKKRVLNVVSRLGQPSVLKKNTLNETMIRS